MLIKILIIACFLMTIGCDSKIEYVQYKLPQKNPTSYIFPFSLKMVQQSVDSVLRKEFASVYTSKDTIIPYGKRIMLLSENKNDFFVANNISATSILYRRKDNNEQLFYTGVVHIHIMALEKNKTSVEVRTLNPKIFIGMRFPQNIIKAIHGGALEKEVSPSTIEEYELLLKFGEDLGVKKLMPPIVLPEAPKDLK